jgi:hypothetical protein
MPVSTLNGWTSAGLLPSSTVVAQILGRAGSGPQAPAAPTAAPAAPPAAVVPPTAAPLPSVPAVVPGGWGGGPASYDPSLMGGGGGRGSLPSFVNPALTPEQAYSQYLQQRAVADSTTPLQAQLHALLNTQQNLAYADPFGPNRSAFNSNPYADTLRAQLQTQIMGAAKASPYAYSYGTPAANAPAPMPAYGYATGYGAPPPGGRSGATNVPGYGFGF